MTVAEIEAVIKLKDELTPQLAKAEGSLTHFGSTVVTVSKTSEAALKAIEKANRDAEKAAAAMTRAVAQFDGSRVFKEAELMARSIANVGGASALTEKELAKANATITEAIAKYRAMGQEVPAHLMALEASTRKMGVATDVASQQTKNFAQTLGSDLKTQIVGTMAGFVSAQAIIGAVSGAFNAIVGVIGSVKDAFVGAVLNTAKLGDELLGLSNKSGIAVERLSAWRYVAGQTGLSVDQITSSVFKLQTELGQGGKATTQALNAVGLSLGQLRAMKPDEAFQQVINKLHDVPNAADRAAVGVALFGKGFKDMAALTREDIGGMMQKFDELGGKISTEMAVSGDAFNDAKADWNVLVERMQTSVGSAILPAATAFVQIMVGAVQKTLNDTSVSAAQFQASITKAFAAIVDVSALLLQGIGVLVSGFANLFFGSWLNQQTGVVKVLGVIGLQMTTLGEAYALFMGQVETANVFKKLQTGILETMKVAFAVEDVSREANATMQRLGDTMTKVGAEMKGKGEAALKAVQAQIAAGALSMRTAQNQLTTGLGLLSTSSDKAAKSLAAVRDELTGKAAVATMEKYALAVQAAGGLSDVTAEGIKKLATAAREALAATVPLTPAAAALVAELGRLGWLEPQLTTDTDALWGSLKELGRIAGEVLPQQLLLAEGAIKTLNAGTKAGQADLTAMLKGLGTIGLEAKPVVEAAGTIGDAFQAAGDLIGKFADKSKAAMVMSMGLSAAAQIAAKNYMGAMTAGVDIAFQMMAKHQAEIEAAWNERMAQIQLAIKLEQDYAKAFGSMSQAIAVASALGLTAAVEAMQRLTMDMDTAEDRILLSATNLGERMDYLFGTIADNAGLASQQLLNVIEVMHRTKATADQMTEFLAGQAKGAGGGLSALIGGLAGSDAAKQRKAISERAAAVQEGSDQEIAAAQARLDSITATEAQLNDELKRLRKEDQSDANEAQQQKLEDQLEALGEQKDAYAQDVQNLKDALAAKMEAFEKESEGVIGVFLQTETQARGLAAAVVASFGEMLARGVPLREAMEAVQPAITSLQQGLDATGFKGGAAFSSLVEMSRIAGDAIMGPAVDAIGGARDALTGLHNAGLLNQESFAGIAMSATQAYDAIVAQGGDGTAALMMMQPTLQTLWKLQQDFGYEVDAGTQALLDQAEAAGIVGAERLSDAEKQTAAQEKLVEQMGELLSYFQRLIPMSENAGYVVKEGFVKAGEAAKDAGEKIKTAKLDQAFKDSDAAAGDLKDTSGEVKQALFDAGKIGVEAWAEVGTGATEAEGNVRLLKGAGDDLIQTFADADFDSPFAAIIQGARDASLAVRELETDVNAVAVGRSPGGLKEWAPQMTRAARVAATTSDTMQRVFGALEYSVNDVTRALSETGMIGPPGSPPAETRVIGPPGSPGAFPNEARVIGPPGSPGPGVPPAAIGAQAQGHALRAIHGLYGKLRVDERQALEKGFAQAQAGGYSKDILHFMDEQLRLYLVAQEGDQRLMTYFYGDTIDALNAILKIATEAATTGTAGSGTPSTTGSGSTSGSGGGGGDSTSTLLTRTNQLLEAGFRDTIATIRFAAGLTGPATLTIPPANQLPAGQAALPITIPVFLDGRQIAEAVYADLPSVLQARGVL